MTVIPRTCQDYMHTGRECGRKGKKGEFFYRDDSGNVFCQDCMGRIARTNLSSSFEQVPGVIDTNETKIIRREATDADFSRWMAEDDGDHVLVVKSAEVYD